MGFHKSLGVVVLAMVVMLLLMTMDSQAIPPPRMFSPVPTTTTTAPTIVTQRTRYGDTNLCKVCSSYVRPCNITAFLPCRANATSVWSARNGSTNAFNNHKKRDRRHAGHNHDDHDHDHNSHTWNNNFKPPPADVQPSQPMKLCKRLVLKKCRQRRCEVKCCDGTPMNTETNACDNKPEDDGIIDSCLNGGTLDSRRTHCTCADGFIGARCQHRKCSIKCQNGGQCMTNTTAGGSLLHSTYNDDYCVCPADTSGRFCENKKCTRECKNNGTCRRRWSWSHCMCAPGFKGAYCEKKDKEGDCPARSTLGKCVHFNRRYECFHDDECEGKKKCCRDSCHARVCVDPYKSTTSCIYNNVTYELGTTFSPDACRVCTCNISHVDSPQGAIHCTRLLCPDLPPTCRNASTPAGQCCPICHVDPAKSRCPGNYTYPYFANCPEGELVIDVQPRSNTALVKLSLTAKDCRGNSLDVTLSDSRLVASYGEDNSRLLSAVSARDTMGNFAECVFTVRIRDPFAPEFQTCPLDFVEPQPGPVTWAVPVARDNVGLAVPPTSSYHPGAVLQAGSHMIEYWAEDFEGNIARCSFVITVGPGPDDYDQGQASRHVGHNQEHRHDHDHNHHDHHDHHDHLALSAGLGIGMTLLIAAAIVFVVIFYRRYRKAQKAASSNSLTVRMGALTAETTSRPAWNQHTAPAPPQYTLSPNDVMSPPLYSSGDEALVAMAAGTQQAGDLPTKTPLPK